MQLSRLLPAGDRRRPPRPRLAAAVALVVATVLAPPAVAAAAPPTLYRSLDADGGGGLTAYPSAGTTWQRCPSGPESCVAATPQADGGVRVGDDPAGTVITATNGGETVSSPPWGGRLALQSPPTVSGTVAVGSHVVPQPATWSGGWPDSFDRLELQACRTEDGHDCVVIFSPRYGACPGGPGRTIPVRYEGWWLRVADTRLGPIYAETDIAYGAPEGVWVATANASTAVATVGRIAPGPAPSTECGTWPPTWPPIGYPPPPARPMPALRTVGLGTYKTGALPRSVSAAQLPAVGFRTTLPKTVRARAVTVARIACATRCRTSIRIGTAARVVRTLPAGVTDIRATVTTIRHQTRNNIATINVRVAGRQATATIRVLR